MQFVARQISSALPFTVVLLVLTANAQAQPAGPQLPAPPPMRFVMHDDRSQLEAAKDAKARVRLTIELADAHLSRMQQLTAQKNFERTQEALGNYLGLIEDVMHFVGSMAQEKNSTRDLYRRLDIALRAQLPRLAVMRRDTPSEFSVHLKAAEEFVRNARSEALDSFYGHTVLREEPVKKEDARNSSQDIKRP
jgi:hypothetical protein